MEVVKGRRRGVKRFVLFVLFLLVALGVVAITYPYWLPYAARPIAKRYGITFKGYERLKDGRFVLTEVVRTNRLFDLKVSRVEGLLPHVWRQKVTETNFTGNFLMVNGWRVVLHERPSKPGGARSVQSDRSVYEHWKQAERYIAEARKWVPRATI
jgi:hypothetical protein